MSRLLHTFAVLLLALSFTSDALAQLRRPLRRTGRVTTVKRTPTRKAPKVSKRAAKKPALLILLENGGVSANLPEPIGHADNKRFPMASCGQLHFALNPGESPAQLVARLGQLLAENRRCANPRAWRVTRVNADTFMRKHSDTLLEEVAKAISLAQNTRGLYDRIVVLEDNQMTPARALNELRRLAPTHEVDVHVLAHGGDEAFYGAKRPRGDGYVAFNESNFFRSLRDIRGLSLGAVYQMNCVSGTLMDDWRRAGAEVVNGTRKKLNNNMPQSYFHFMRHWLNGGQYGYAIGEAYKEAARYTRPVYEALGLKGYVEASYHLVRGDRRRVAKPSANPAYTVAETGKQTAIELAQDLVNQGKTLAQLFARLRAAGHSLLTSARAAAEATNCSARELATALLEANVNAGQVVVTVSQVLTASQTPTAVAKAMLAFGLSATEVASALRSKLQNDRDAIAQVLRSAGCNAHQVALALRDALHATNAQIADTLKTLGYSTRTLAKVFKRTLGRGHRATAKALVAAGCRLTDVVKVLRDEFKCSLATIASDLRAAGQTFNVVARAIWDASHKSVASLNALGNALASAFSRNLAQVMGNLANLGIQA